MQEMEELKRKMMKEIERREVIPKETEKMIQTIFDRLKQVYEKLNCKYVATENYIDGIYNQFEIILSQNIGESRKEEQKTQVMQILNKIENDMENVDMLVDTKFGREQFVLMKGENEAVTEKIIELLKDSMTEVKTGQGGILFREGYNMDRIQQIEDVVQKSMRKFIDENREKISIAFQKDEESLKKQLLREYEEYLLQNRQKEEMEQEEKSRREEFAEGLDSGISLEEQRDFAIQHTKGMGDELEQKQETKQKQVEGLPDNVIE